jgi:hypothetical protein
MVVEKVNIAGVAALETENHPPVPANDHGPEALPVTGRRMQPEAWRIHVIGEKTRRRHAADVLLPLVRPPLSHSVRLFPEQIALVACAMHRAMMPATERDRKLIADLAAERHGAG